LSDIEDISSLLFYQTERYSFSNAKDPEGFSSYKEVQKWLASCCDLQVSYRTVHQWVHYRLQGKLKVPRPVSIKQKEGVVEEFKKNCMK
jgi:putative transposase